MLLPGGLEAVIDPEDEGQRDAAGELVNLMCGSMTRALGTMGCEDLRVSQSVDELTVMLAHQGRDELDYVGRKLLGVHVDTRFEGVEARAWCLLTEDLARELVRAGAGARR